MKTKMPSTSNKHPRRVRGLVVRASFALAWLPLIGGCAISTPYKAIETASIGSPDDKLLVSVTHGTLYPDKRASFDEHTMLVCKEMAAQPGLVAYAIRREFFGNQVWTLTIWRDNESRMKFFMSPVHQKAIAFSEEAIESVRYKREDIKRSELPYSWDRALALLGEPTASKKP